jgi:cysteine synthase B
MSAQTQTMEFLSVPRPQKLRFPAATTLSTGVGNTPLYRLNISRSLFDNVEILAKAEWMNASGSIKDRAASFIIRAAEESGALRPTQTLLDSSSGNFGTSLAMMGASRGYKVTLCVPSSVPEDRKELLKALGAEVTFTDPSTGSDGAILAARNLAASYPDRYFYTDQYSNPANWQAHYYGTAEEIWSQAGGEITHFVAGLGSSGTFIGTARRLRELDPSIRCIALLPDCQKHGLRGMKDMDSAIRPAIYDETVADELLRITTPDAIAACRKISHEDGMFVGVTSGAALAGCLEVARRSTRPTRIVTIFPDSGMNCLAELTRD